MELGSTGNYLRGAGEQAHNLRDLGGPAKKVKCIFLENLTLKEKPPFCSILFFKFIVFTCKTQNIK